MNSTGGEIFSPCLLHRNPLRLFAVLSPAGQGRNGARDLRLSSGKREPKTIMRCWRENSRSRKRSRSGRKKVGLERLQQEREVRRRAHSTS